MIARAWAAVRARPWLQRLVLLAMVTPVVMRFSPQISAICNIYPAVSARVLAVVFCGFTVALWTLELSPASLAFPAALGMTCLYFSSGTFFRSEDWIRVVLMVGLMLVPLRLVSRVPAARVTWPAAYLPTLDGWRAIAILLVIVDHCARDLAAVHHQPLPVRFFYGQHGVNIFFGISGLLITWKLLEEQRYTGKISLQGFYRRRVYRIFPAAITFVVVIGALALAGVAPLNRMDLASTVLYFRNYVPVLDSGNVVTAHFWSLALEEQFYLALPAALVLLGSRRLQSLALILVALCSGWRWYFLTFFAPPHSPLSLRYRTELRIDGLLCGCLMAIVLSDERARRFMARVLSAPVWILLLLVFAWIITINGEYTTLAESLLIPLLLAGTMLAPNKVASRVLEWRPLRWIGRVSYSLYLWQQLFLFAPRDNWLLGGLRRFPINVAAIFACAALSYYFIERPMIRRAVRPDCSAREQSLPATEPSLITS